MIVVEVIQGNEAVNFEFDDNCAVKAMGFLASAFECSPDGTEINIRRVKEDK